MKPRFLNTLPRTLFVQVAPIVACATAHAAIVHTNESNTTNEWSLPAGANLLSGATAHTPASPQQPDHGNTDQTSGSWGTLTDGTVGDVNNKMHSVAPNNNNSVVFPLDTSVNVRGYNITQFDAYGAWPDSGRDNLNFSIEYSKVGAPDVFLPLAVINNQTSAPNRATHTRLAEDVTGLLATDVHSLRFIFGSPVGQENGWVGYREFIALGTPIPLTDPLTWTGGGGTGGVGGTADWEAAGNWKKTVDGTAAVYDESAALTFDATGQKRNISLTGQVISSSIDFTHGDPTNYVFTDADLQVNNKIVLSGAGGAVFENFVRTVTGVVVSGGGSLSFRNGLEGPGVSVTGAGSLNLESANPTLLGKATISAGVLNVRDDAALSNVTLEMSGGTANFTTSVPTISSLVGTGGTVVLGNTASPVNPELYVGANDTTANTFAGNITNAASDEGNLTKAGDNTIVLAGSNSYTGATSVIGGTLEFAKRSAFYGGNISSSDSLLFASLGTMGFRVGGVDEFTSADIAGLDLSGFSEGSRLGLNVATGTFTTDAVLEGSYALAKHGAGTLQVSGTNTYTGGTDIYDGTLEAANPNGPAFLGNVVVGHGGKDVFLNMAANDQFSPDSVVVFSPGPGQVNGKMQLRGTNQTVAGLDSSTNNRVSLIQNDETGSPGFTANPGPATLTINATQSHSFAGLIRNQNGDSVSLIKNGPGTQEFINVPIASYAFNGPTTINEGVLKLNFSGPSTGWNSNFTLAEGTTLELAGVFNMFRTISGEGKLLKTGPGMISVVNQDGYANANSFTGGTVISEGVLKFFSNGGSSGSGTGPGEFCAAGPMDPSNVIEVINGATLGVGGIAPLGNSGVLPQYAPTVNIRQGGRLWGSEGNDIAFVSNVNLEGALIEVMNGSVAGGFNTNITLVGTVTVRGTGASRISTTGTGPNANVSLGSLGQPGTTFDVANSTSSSAPDLIVSSLLKNIGPNGGVPSPLIKTGVGTMFVQNAQSYTGYTHVMEGELRLDTEYLADTSSVSIDDTGFLNLIFTESDVVDSLFLGGVQVEAGVYGSMTNSDPGVIKTPRILGSGTLNVSRGPGDDPYIDWSAVITDIGLRDRGLDADGDGFTNLQEYLFGTSPISGNGNLATIEKTPGGLIVRWSERIGANVSYVLEESDTMAQNDWEVSTAVPVDAEDQSGAYSSDYVVREALIPVDDTKKFVRVKAVE